MHGRALHVLLVAASVLTAAPALAHPFGPPPTARVQADGERVIVDWAAAPDDAIAIGEKIGVLPAGSTEAYRGGVTQGAPSATAEAELAASPKLRSYLLHRITVTQDGASCATDLASATDFVNNGARVVATCPATVTTVDLSITMLTDIHTAYRTFAVGQGTTPAQFVYTLEEPTQRWDFTGGEADASRTNTTAVPISLGVAAGLAAAAAIWLRRRRNARGAARH